MAKTYVFVRMPSDIHAKYKIVKQNMENDLSRVAGKPIKLTMPRVFNAVIDPRVNENYIQIDLKRMLKGVRK